MLFDDGWNSFNVAQASIERSVHIRLVQRRHSVVSFEGLLLHDADAIWFEIDSFPTQPTPREWR